MKSATQYTSKIATLVYKEYTENIDMNNSAFKQSELNALIKNDKDIVRVDCYINGVLVGNVMHTSKKALSQVVKMTESQSRIQDELEPEYGSDFYARAERNQKRFIKINELNEKIKFYSQFVTEDDFNNCEYDFCMSYKDFMN